MARRTSVEAGPLRHPRTAVGGVLMWHAVSGIAVLFGVIPQQSPLQNLATAPEFIWEAFLGVWLTFKGFKPVALDAAQTPDVGTGAGSPVDAVVAA